MSMEERSVRTTAAGFHPAPTPHDVEFLASLTSVRSMGAGDIRRALAEDDAYLDRVVATQEVRRLFATDAADDDTTLFQLSPWLVFSLYLRLARRELEPATAVPEWTGWREVVPVFDADLIETVLSDRAIRLQLERVLTRFTRVGTGWYATWERGRLTRRRWNDLDPRSLLRLLPYAEGEVAADLLRRAGDAHLFLAGVFPEHVLRHLGQDLETWERKGQGLYRAAAARYEADAPAWSADLERLGAQFHGARRSLNYVMQRFWVRRRTAWFRPTEAGPERQGVA